jgi:hypothetical protein
LVAPIALSDSIWPIATSTAPRLRKITEADAWPIDVQSPTFIQDTPSTHWRELRAGLIRGGPAGNGYTYWSKRIGDAIEAAAIEAQIVAWDSRIGNGSSRWESTFRWESTGVSQPLVLRRRHDRMATAVLMPVLVFAPWKLGVVE